MQSWLETILVLLFLAAITSVLLLLPKGRYGGKSKSNRTQILVLGDIGRSPRMQNHAISMLKHGIPVDLIGYVDSELHPRLRDQKNLTVYPLAKTPKVLQSGGKTIFLITGPLKVLFQVVSLWVILVRRTPPARWLLVQNPPSIPTLLISTLTCRLRGTKLAVDWHNFGYTILALRLGASHPLVRLARAYEHFFARFADASFAVSEAMVRRMEAEFGSAAASSRKKSASGTATTSAGRGVMRLYDRPVEEFTSVAQSGRQGEGSEFLAELDLGLEERFRKGLKVGRVRAVVSSTSWTADEDFGVLLAALVEYSRLATTSEPQLPEMLVVITGKGPLKEMYLGKIAELEAKGDLEMVTIRTAWLATGDYARLLASADLGVSLHQSSSGVDLPMKVVDMFGAGLPVIGWSRYESWPELVKDGVNGRDFASMEELRDVLVELLGKGWHKLRQLKAGALKEGKYKWQDEWDSVVGRSLGYLK